jgi:hypothetical protein
MCTTSNELLVSSDLIIPRSKDGPEAATADLVLRVHDYMEPKEMLPKLDKLQRLLPTFALSNDRKVFSNQLFEPKVFLFNRKANQKEFQRRNCWIASKALNFKFKRNSNVLKR